MPEPGDKPRAEELRQQLARLERELDNQRLQLAALRREMTLLVSTPAAFDPNYPSRVATPVISPAMSTPPPPVPEAVPGPFQAPQPIAEFRSIHVPASVTPEKTGPHRTVENRIGSQLFNRIGIIALLIGVALALKFAYDQGWLHVSPIGRIVSGLLLGAGVVLWSERFRRKGYGAFSYSMKAIGTGTLYLTLWASFQIYHLLPASVALAAMIAVTAWNAAMAWMQDSELLAAYALVGGFASPALLGSGGNHEGFLFSYILAMDVAVLFLLTKKPWQRLLLGSFPATVIYFIGWYTKFWSPDQALITGLFAVLLAAPFIALALFGKQRDDIFEGVFAPFGAAAFLSLALYSVLEDSGRHGWLPWGTVALAALYLLLMRVRRSGLAEPVHLALAVVFLIIAIPLKTSGRWITIGWLAEGDALLWVATRMLPENVQPRVQAVMRWLGTIALSMGVAESLIFWSQQDAQHSFLNARFATEIAAVAAVALAAWLTRTAQLKSEAQNLQAPAWPILTLIGQVAVHLLAPLAVGRELAAYWTVDTAAPASLASYHSLLQTLTVSAWVMFYGAALIAWLTLRPTSAPSPLQRKVLTVLASIYLGLGLIPMLAAPIASAGVPTNAFWNARLLVELAGAFALAVTARMAWRARAISGEPWVPIAAGTFVAFHLLVILTGVHEIFTYFGLHVSTDASLAESFSISAWLMLYAAALLAAGFWKRMAFIRWQGLLLMVFTIVKVFLYDMHSLSSGYRILSFFGLGLVLMVISFAYQKDWLHLRDAGIEAAE